MQDTKFEDKGEADEGECIEPYEEERRPSTGAVSWPYGRREYFHQPSVLVSQERTGETCQNKYCAKNAKSGINFGGECGGGGIGTCGGGGGGGRNRQGDVDNGRK